MFCVSLLKALVRLTVIVINLILQYWAHRRWVNPSDPQEQSAVAAKLAHFQQIYSPLRQCSLERILDVIFSLHMQSHAIRDSGSERDSDSAHASRPDKTPMLPSLARLGWMCFTSDPSLGQAHHLPPLSTISATTVSSPHPRATLPCRALLQRLANTWALTT